LYVELSLKEFSKEGLAFSEAAEKATESGADADAAEV
jgi:hypothetical protein